MGISRKFSKPLLCIVTLMHHCRICHTATHTCTHMAELPTWGKYTSRWVFPGPRLCLPSVLLTAVPSTRSYPTPGLLIDIPSVKTGQQLYIILKGGEIRGPTCPLYKVADQFWQRGYPSRVLELGRIAWMGLQWVEKRAGKAEGHDRLTVNYTYLSLDNPASSLLLLLSLFCH